MSTEQESEFEFAAAQYIPPEEVLAEIAEVGAKRACGLKVPQVMILSIIAGGFIGVGATFSTLIASGTTNEGAKKLLEGWGFSVGFFLVVLSGGLLFTEVNVELPATMLKGRRDKRGFPMLRNAVLKLWLLAALGNMIGAFVFGQAIGYVSNFGDGFDETLREVITLKMSYREIGGAEGFFKAIISGILANWLVGMAAFLSAMGRSIIGKYIPVMVTVMAFVAGGWLHSPANMAYMSIIQPLGFGPGWGEGLLWAILPAAIGNIIGAFFLVALPFHLASKRFGAKDEAAVAESAA